MDLMHRTCKTERMNVERLFARVFVVIGGLVWVLMAFASNTAARYSNLTYTLTEVVDAGVSALIPLALAIAVFVLGMFYEQLTALVLFLAAGATVVWGVLSGWEPLLWANIMLVAVAPMIIGAVLFLLASRTETVCQLQEKS